MGCNGNSGPPAGFEARIPVWPGAGGTSAAVIPLTDDWYPITDFEDVRTDVFINAQSDTDSGEGVDVTRGIQYSQTGITIAETSTFGSSVTATATWSYGAFGVLTLSSGYRYFRPAVSVVNDNPSATTDEMALVTARVQLKRA